MIPAIHQHQTQPASNNLGNTANSLHAARKAAPDAGLLKARTVRYELQRAAGGLLFDFSAGKRQKFRVVHCSRSIQGDGVNVHRTVDGKRARFGGLTTCGSGWTCPVCALKIAEVRRAELSKALVQHVTAGGRVHLMTLTFPHEADWPLADLMARFDKARNRFTNSRAFKKILGKDGAATCKGRVSSLEITNGQNGWHPHLHVLLFVRRSLTIDEGEILQHAWVSQLLKAGLGDNSKLSDMMAHALDLRGGEDAADYVVKYGREEKWGLTSELTRTHTKETAHESLTPFGLLGAYMDGDTVAAGRFVEFADAFLGKRLLTWTPGLRKEFDLSEDDSDEAAAAAAEVEEQKVGRLSSDQWKIVLERNARAELLNFAAEQCIDPDCGQADLNDFITWISKRPKVAKGWFWTPMQEGRPSWM